MLGLGGTRRKVQKQLAQVTTMPASTGGIDVRMPIAEMPKENCIYTYNLMPSEYGMLLRYGYREWALGTEDVSSVGINTLITYAGSEPDKSDDRLFAVTNEGIWDVTTYDSPPILKYAFTIDTTEEAGYGVYCHYVNGAGDELMVYADSRNGLFQYDEATDTWAQATGITGPDVTKINFVTVHKQRIWLVEQQSTIGWYLPVGSNSGQATEFYFGPKFVHGGNLVALYNWSVDGGAGLDDILVALSSSGDLIPWQGADPSSADTWSSIGTYYIGEIPKGRHNAGEYGGDLTLMSAYGLIGMADLIRGVDAKNVAEASLTFKITRNLREQLLLKGDEFGWAMDFMPAIGSFVITIPQTPGYPYVQFVMSLTTQAWGYWRDVPARTVTEFQGKVYFGTTDNRVMVMDVYRDDVKITPPAEGDNGKQIEFSLLTTPQRYGSDGRYKQVTFIRPDFWSSNEPAYNIKPVYEFNSEEQALAPSKPLFTGDLWDTDKWDEAVWGGGGGFGHDKLLGGGGVGRNIAIALRGEATAFCRLISFDVQWIDGGPI